MKLLLTSTLAFLLCTGCGAAYWGGATEVHDTVEVSKSLFSSSFKIVTTKNTQLKLGLEKAEFNRTTGLFELKGLTADYNGNSADVITAQGKRALDLVPVMHEQVLYQEAIGKNIERGILAGGTAGAQIIGAATQPLLGATGSLDTPLGKGNVTLGGGAVGPPAPAKAAPAKAKAKAATQTPAAVKSK